VKPELSLIFKALALDDTKPFLRSGPWKGGITAAWMVWASINIFAKNQPAFDLHKCVSLLVLAWNKPQLWGAWERWERIG